MIDNDPILWTMLNAIKEQNGLLQSQGEQIATLNEQNRAMKAQVDEISDLKAQLKILQAAMVLNAETKNPARKQVAERVR